MNSAGLIGIFDGITAPNNETSSSPIFAARQVPGSECYFVGKDANSQACLLVATMDGSGRNPPPIRLESLDAQFELICQITDADGQMAEGRFTVVRCRSRDVETIRYFLSVCGVLIRHLGDLPSRSDLASAVQRIASIFQSLRKPPVRSLNGLFGELFLISRSRNPERSVAAWRIDEGARFDFSVGDVRLEVKTSAGRARKHVFSYEQCNPPSGTEAIVASLLVERIPGGLSLANLITDIETRISKNEDLLLKLHDVTASTLGTSISGAMDVCFDPRLAESSLLFFDLREIPAIRGELTPGVSDVRFASDLVDQSPLTASSLIDRDPLFWELMPDQTQ
ncbi:PD-(D/E)XK motif protein [Alphaproteobacteria bacterium GH1-50]|uniref:PD-(D/E)XK motif protein n=1 Tax=Kangsaoukella pontilimi TaxID=2691042 RepID=A0A7C9MJT2_9RHOB|nr:PD-(D/E)XK motif protein [Kangsaoukella pontilimi]MXQ08015.1 PD-(D/E)XK motif protein [Kangsaoukella pontilimi]